MINKLILHTEFNNKKDIKALIVYGSTSGNAELVASAMFDGLKDININVEIYKSELANPQIINNYDLTILICSTWNVGLLNDYFIKFHSEFIKLQFPGKKIQVVGLGDSVHYDIFCGAADILEESVAKVGAVQPMPTLRIDGPPHAKLNEFRNWAKTLIAKI